MGPYIHTFHGRGTCGACKEMATDGAGGDFIAAQHLVQLWMAVADHHRYVAGDVLVRIHLGDDTSFVSDAVEHAKISALARLRVGEASERLRLTPWSR